MAWMLTDDWRLEVRKLDDEWLVFHEGDAQTHRLSGIVGLVFEVFWKNKVPLTVVELNDRARKLESDELDESSIDQAIRTLSSVNLLKVQK